MTLVIFKNLGRRLCFSYNLYSWKGKNQGNVAVSNGRWLCPKAHENYIAHILILILTTSVQVSTTILPFFRLFLYILCLLPLGSQLSLLLSRYTEVDLTTCRFQITVVPFPTSGSHSLNSCKISVCSHGKDKVQDERNSYLQSELRKYLMSLSIPHDIVTSWDSIQDSGGICKHDFYPNDNQQNCHTLHVGRGKRYETLPSWSMLQF